MRKSCQLINVDVDVKKWLLGSNLSLEKGMHRQAFSYNFFFQQKKFEKKKDDKETNIYTTSTDAF